MTLTSKDAWQAYEAGAYEAAAQLWLDLLEASKTESERRELELGYGYTLVGLGLFEEARALYWRLFDETGAPLYLHQWGMVEREAGAFDGALRVFSLERSLLSENDTLYRAGNLYELGLVRGLMGDDEDALAAAEACLELSLQTTDGVMLMHGCSYRLLGDLFRALDEAVSKDFYRRAYEAFERAKDAVACTEIQQRITELDRNS